MVARLPPAVVCLPPSSQGQTPDISLFLSPSLAFFTGAIHHALQNAGSRKPMSGSGVRVTKSPLASRNTRRLVAGPWGVHRPCGTLARLTRANHRDARRCRMPSATLCTSSCQVWAMRWRSKVCVRPGVMRRMRCILPLRLVASADPAVRLCRAGRRGVWRHRECQGGV